jgi:predicted transposase YbfD/YdcC
MQVNLDLQEAAMNAGAVGTLSESFSGIDDPRTNRGKRHDLMDIISIAVCAIICGAEGWADVELFAKCKYDWLKGFLSLSNGIPSHDTFGRVFSRIDPKQFQNCFMEWVKRINELTQGQVIAIDGKTLRRSHDKSSAKAAIHMVSAWATENSLVLGQTKVDEKSNEITAIPELLSLLDLSGCIVTIDAMGCQKKIAQQIVSQDADYVLAVKENQGRLLEDVEDLFSCGQRAGFEDMKHDFCQTLDKGHGRIETRRCWTIDDPEQLSYIETGRYWPGLRSIGMVTAERRRGNQVSVESRYYISSLESDAGRLLQATRSHWGIENRLHWVLDLSFREDESRVRTGNASENLAIIRHMALNLLRKDRTSKVSIKARRKLAGWDNDYLLSILSN